MIDLTNSLVEQLQQMGDIVNISWGDDSEESDSPSAWTVILEDADGKTFKTGGSVRFHDSDREYKFVFLNIILHWVFSANGIDCPYWYPYNIRNVAGLINDARNLMKLKKLGRTSEFEFKYVLSDLRGEGWKRTRLFRRRKRNYINPSA